MYSYEEIINRSAVEDEIVVGYADAMELLRILRGKTTRVLGWEGWVKYADGSLGHSLEHQGTVDLSSMSRESAIMLSESTITLANKEWQDNPEISNAELLFCITTDH